MARPENGAKRALIGRIVASAKRTHKSVMSGGGEAFVRTYFARVPYDDIKAREVSELAGEVLGFLAFAHKRNPGKSSVRVFNPETGKHGWASDHTVVEIVNDNMPFLVDSVAMSLNARGLNVHLVVHPVMHVWRDGSGVLKAVGAAKRPAASWKEAFGIPDACRDRPSGGRQRDRRDPEDRGKRAGPGARRRSRLDGNAYQARRDHERSLRRRHRCDRGEHRGPCRDPRFPQVARRRPLHFSRLPPL